MRSRPVLSRLPPVGNLAAHPPLGQLCHRFELCSSAVRHRASAEPTPLEYPSPRSADVGIFQHLVQPVRRTALLLQEPGSIAGQVAQVSLFFGWYETPLSRPKLINLAISRIAIVCLAASTWANDVRSRSRHRTAHAVRCELASSELLSMATWVTPCLDNQSDNLHNSLVVVPKVSLTTSTLPSSWPIRTFAITLVLWTSSPLHRENTTSISLSPWQPPRCARLRALSALRVPPCGVHNPWYVGAHESNCSAVLFRPR